MIKVHCINHHINLAVQTLSKLAIVGEIEDVLQSRYAYFSHLVQIKELKNWLNWLTSSWKFEDNVYSRTLKFGGFLCYS
jgi:hypothetical protein